MKTFVYGATGQVGSLIVDKLLAAGHQVSAGSRTPEQQVQKPGLTWTRVDIASPSAGLDALEGVDNVFLMSPPFHTDQYAVLNPWVEKAAQVGVKKIVLMTAMGMEHAPAEAPFRKLELALVNSGTAYNIIRPNWFMQNFHTFWVAGILEQETIFFPAGQAETSFVHALDIADSAFALLNGDKFQGREFTLTGKESLTHSQVAAMLNRSTGMNIGYADISPEEFRASLVQGGVPADYADLLVALSAGLAAGQNQAVTGDVLELTGREPIGFAEYAEANKQVWLGKTVAHKK